MPFIGHYPWFATYNYLSRNDPVPDGNLEKLGRNAVIGFCSSLVSDTTSNSVRVLKTFRQTSSTKAATWTRPKVSSQAMELSVCSERIKSKADRQRAPRYAVLSTLEAH